MVQYNIHIGIKHRAQSNLEYNEKFFKDNLGQDYKVEKGQHS